MTDPLHIVCPHCHTTNRVRQADLAQAPDCGGCHKPLFMAHSLALTEPLFDRHVSRSRSPCWSTFGRPGAAPAGKWHRLLSRPPPSLNPRCGW